MEGSGITVLAFAKKCTKENKMCNILLVLNKFIYFCYTL